MHIKDMGPRPLLRWYTATTKKYCPLHCLVIGMRPCFPKDVKNIKEILVGDWI